MYTLLLGLLLGTEAPVIAPNDADFSFSFLFFRFSFPTCRCKACWSLAGKTEKKEHLLAETDDMWVALRHKHFAAATIEITRTLDEFRSKNKAAAYKQGGGGDGALDMRNMKNLVSSLPQYR